MKVFEVFWKEKTPRGIAPRSCVVAARKRNGQDTYAVKSDLKAPLTNIGNNALLVPGRDARDAVENYLKDLNITSCLIREVFLDDYEVV